MTRTAAEVQAEIEALGLSWRVEASDLKVDYERAWIQHRYEDAVVIGRRQLDAAQRLDDAVAPLCLERDRLVRVELDATTPSDVRRLATRLRRAYLGYAAPHLLHDDGWGELSLDEARAWVAVAREADR